MLTDWLMSTSGGQHWRYALDWIQLFLSGHQWCGWDNFQETWGSMDKVEARQLRINPRRGRGKAVRKPCICIKLNSWGNSTWIATASSLHAFEVQRYRATSSRLSLICANVGGIFGRYWPTRCVTRRRPTDLDLTQPKLRPCGFNLHNKCPRCSGWSSSAVISNQRYR